MTSEAPLVSVLITTYNRARLVPRAIQSVLDQTFSDLEIVVIDDCSTDNTPDVVRAVTDPRIRYFRNETNVGAIEGDRAHVRRFVYELMRGKYFLYLCDDDYWLPRDLLERQVALFEKNPELSSVFGNQLSYFLSTPESYFGGSPDATVTLTRENLAPYFDFKANRSKSPHIGFLPKLFPRRIMTSDQYLEHFAKDPASCNRVDGGTLFSREAFMKAGVFRSTDGSQWQAGYEFKLGPACVGGVAFLDEPAIVTEIRDQNASFRGTQRDHYLDSVKSIEVAFSTPIADAPTRERKRFLRRMRAETIRNITRSFLGNTIRIRATGVLGMCSAENMARPVTYREVIPAYSRNMVWPEQQDITLLYDAERTPREGSVENPIRAIAFAQRAASFVETINARGEKRFYGN